MFSKALKDLRETVSEQRAAALYLRRPGSNQRQAWQWLTDALMEEAIIRSDAWRFRNGDSANAENPLSVTELREERQQQKKKVES